MILFMVLCGFHENVTIVSCMLSPQYEWPKGRCIWLCIGTRGCGIEMNDLLALATKCFAVCNRLHLNWMFSGIQFNFKVLAHHRCPSMQRMSGKIHRWCWCGSYPSSLMWKLHHPLWKMDYQTSGWPMLLMMGDGPYFRTSCSGCCPTQTYLFYGVSTSLFSV